MKAVNYTKKKNTIHIEEKDKYDPIKEYQKFLSFCECSNCNHHLKQIEECLKHKHGK